MSVACGIECVVVLKGSSHGRTTDKPEGEIDEITTLKDLDCEFLEAERIMDYSLLGCIRWVWRRCTYIGANDNATWTTAVPRVCRLVLAIYEHDLHNPYFIPTCGFHPNPDWVFKRVTYDVSMTSNRPSHVSVDSRPACGPAWAGGQAKGWAGVHKQVLGNIWIGCWVNDEAVELL